MTQRDQPDYLKMKSPTAATELKRLTALPQPTLMLSPLTAFLVIATKMTSMRKTTVVSRAVIKATPTMERYAGLDKAAEFLRIMRRARRVRKQSAQAEITIHVSMEMLLSWRKSNYEAIRTDGVKDQYSGNGA